VAFTSAALKAGTDKRVVQADVIHPAKKLYLPLILKN
jgi:hypothetical protein